MNLSTVAANLRNTIAGKEKALVEYQKAWDVATLENESALYATIKFLEINIDELRRILADVEKCEANGIEQSWRLNPDRMGGQFTQDEIDNAGRWV